MMGAQVTSGGAIDLNTLTDANAYSERLKVLNEQAAQAKTILEQARAENQDMVAKKAEVEAINAATLEMLNRNVGLEADLKKREGALIEQAKAVADGEYALADARQQFNAELAAGRVDQTNRENALRQREKEAAASIADRQAAVDAALAKRESELDAAHRDAMAAAYKLAEQATQREQEAAGAYNEAEAVKSEYRAKLAALKSIVS